MNEDEKTVNETENKGHICAETVPRNRYQGGYVAGHKKGMEDCNAEIERLQDRVHELETKLRRLKFRTRQGIHDHSGFTEDEKRIALDVIGKALEGK